MLFSTLKVIMGQLPQLCAKVGVGKYDQENAYFRGLEGKIEVTVGEIHLGGEYRFTFSRQGELLRCSHGVWGPGDSGPTYRPFMLAREDAEGDAQPLTTILASHPAGHCVQPGINALSYEVRDDSPDIDG